MTNQANNTVNTEATATETKPVFRAGTSRAVALELFTAKLPERSTLGNTEFRKAVIADMMEQQKIGPLIMREEIFGGTKRTISARQNLTM